MMRRAAVVAVGVIAVVASALAGCAHDGTTLRAPAPGATAPPVSTTAAKRGNSIGGIGTAPLMAMTSPAFVQRGAIPAEYTCVGDNVSPPLQWTGIPAGTKELAITVSDIDAPNGNFVHWIVAGLPPSLTALGRGAAPEGAVQTKNDGGTVGWTGPCPPVGKAHNYVFTLYALEDASGVTDATDPHTALDMIGQVPGQASTLTGTFQHP
jgi:Raf kinase inhibitor-like YbhB/YbcL family protein